MTRRRPRPAPRPLLPSRPERRRPARAWTGLLDPAGEDDDAIAIYLVLDRLLDEDGGDEDAELDAWERLGRRRVDH